MRLRRGTTALLAAVLLIPAQPARGEPDVDPTTLVNPFVGTQNFGNTFPGASTPFGMVQVSPDTGGQGGYDYLQDSILGFSQTHLSGVGCGVAGELPVMPTTGAVDNVDIAGYRSKFSHDDEEATPGYYRVGLQRYGVDAELTATPRTGWQRYTFPAGPANVLVNTGRANQQVLDSEVHVVGDRTLEGRVRAGRFCAGHDEHTVYFTASFDRPFTTFGTWRGTTKSPGVPDAAGTGGNGAWVTFDASTDRDVVLK
ncbi:MAG: glycoside hydrolase family 92 protein, partial [Saccharothrix sp.]|nr:glycoside hydrolase family 92 protein [Saccharothrix sp.]